MNNKNSEFFSFEEEIRDYTLNKILASIILLDRNIKKCRAVIDFIDDRDLTTNEKKSIVKININEIISELFLAKEQQENVQTFINYNLCQGREKEIRDVRDKSKHDD